MKFGTWGVNMIKNLALKSYFNISKTPCGYVTNLKWLQRRACGPQLMLFLRFPLKLCVGLVFLLVKLLFCSYLVRIWQLMFFLTFKAKRLCAYYSGGSFTLTILAIQKFNAQRANFSRASQIYSIQNYPLKVVLKL